MLIISSLNSVMLNLINKEQQTTVRIIDQPLIINAGPGTGKTKTLVAKILYLINGKHYKPSSILALTFTKKAAEEIHARIRDGAKSQDLKGIFTGTFHAFGLKVLEEFDNGQNKEIKIVENAEQKKIIKKIASEKDVKETALLISNYKNSNYTNQTDKQSEIKQLVDMYNQELKKQGLIDYDDLLLNTLTLIRQSKNVKEALQNRFKYILIDEFQDTNKIQYEILRELVTKDGKAGIAGTAEIGICVIGDPLQSIYGFRGARGGVFDDFKKELDE
ncbi:MAG: ATP-dependent DNA helicase PcrA, partial [candidate division WS6 bacterium GW2011_GWA2_37_6]